jgi:hypothetical protein
MHAPAVLQRVTWCSTSVIHSQVASLGAGVVDVQNVDMAMYWLDLYLLHVAAGRVVGTGHHCYKSHSGCDEQQPIEFCCLM